LHPIYQLLNANMELVIVTTRARLANGFDARLTAPVSIPFAIATADTDGDVAVVAKARLVLRCDARFNTAPFGACRHAQTLRTAPIIVTTLPANTLTSDLTLTGRRATVAVVLVSIIASLMTFGAELNIFSNDPVTAASKLAAYAGVLIKPVSVIADLKTVRIFSQVLPDDSVTAGGHRAAASAGIAVDEVTIITSLGVGLADLQITASDAIAADRKLAGVAARIGIFKVTVITGFALVKSSVTAP
jgi:hypothetical protein